MFKRKTLLQRWDDNYAGIPVPADNKKGFKVEYVYYGPWYYWNLPEAELKKEKRIIAGISILSLPLYFAFAMLSSPLNYKALVVIPGMVALAVHILELVADVRFLTASYRLNRMTFEDIDWIMKLTPKLRAYLLAASAVFGVIYLPFGCFSVLSLLVIAANAGCAYLAMYIYKRYGKLTSHTEKNTTLETMDRLDVLDFRFPGMKDYLTEEEKKKKEAEEKEKEEH